MIRLLFLALLLASPALAAPPATETRLTLKVTGVHDGDCITCLLDDEKELKIRLDAIDAPELGQPFGRSSKNALSNLVFGKTVTVIEKKKDRWGRTVAHVLVDGKDTNLMMLEQGMAWHYTDYSKNKRLQKTEDDARAAKLGLWADPHAMPPWEWRKLDKDERARRRSISPVK